MSERIATDRIYHYFVTYMSTGGESSFGFGNLAVQTSHRIRDIYAIHKIEADISTATGRVVTVTNWKLLRSVKNGSGKPPENDEKAVQESSPSKG